LPLEVPEVSFLKLAEKACGNRSPRSSSPGDRGLLCREIEAGGAGARPGFLLVDLDRFEATTVTFGHHVADLLLEFVQARIEAAVGSGQRVFWLGGAEFGVLLPGIRSKHARALALRLLADIERPFTIDGRRVCVRAHAGLAFGPAGQVKTLLRDAEVSIYEAKRRTGTDRLAVLDEEARDEIITGLALSSELTGAVERQELVLDYQPIVELATRTVVGHEALVRWQHPERGLISPGTFIPLAEDAGLMDEIGAWILTTACREATRWPGRDGGEPYVSVNVAVQQLHGCGFHEMVARALEATGLAAGRLVLEVTETAVAEADAISPALRALREADVRIFMDDFGTGFASLGLIRELPLDGVKIDQSFISHITTSDQEWSLVLTIMRMLRELGLATTAEGVESAAQVAQLRSLGCAHGQGYYFGRPQAQVVDG
jgi:diguanylate cyclase (GGDEF)-like protein